MGFARAWILAAFLPGLGACGGSTTSGDAGGPGGNGLPDAGTDGAVGMDTAGLSCAERTRAAAALVSAAAADAENDLSCQTDEDCVVVWATTDCSDTCSDLVSRTGAGKIQAAIDEANATVCRGFHEAGCMLIRPPCAVPPPWVCLAGMCTLVLH